MRATIFLFLLTSCYDKSDAVRQLEEMGRTKPTCVFMNSGHDGANKSFACTDSTGTPWVCDKDGCIQWSR
jgi:hypothetical protein